MVEKKTKKESNTDKFTKEQILKSKKFSERRDILSVLLNDDKTYSLEEAEELIKGFMEENFKKEDK